MKFNKKKRQGKLLFEQQADGEWIVKLYRNDDKGTQKLKNFLNAESWSELHDQEEVIEFFKVGKQVRVFEIGEEEPFYDSTTPATTPVFKRRKNRGDHIKNPLRNNNDGEPLIHPPFSPPSLPDSFLLKNTKVPADVRKIKINSEKIDNFHLKLNRFARYEKEDFEKKVKEKFYFFNAKAIKNKAKQVLLDTFQIKANFEKIDFDNITTRQRQHATALLGNDQLQQQNFQPNWRLVVGLGGASVYETSITLHHVYGFPYIPASSVKGVLRSYLIQTMFFPKLTEQEQTDEKAGEKAEAKALEDPEFVEIFGSTDQRGKVTFFDALPTETPTIQPDIMNPHYPEWYDESKNKPPADTQSPVPIYFLTVTNTSFQFLFGSKLLDGSEKLWGGEKTLADWLKEALYEHGIGAKTAVGYGVME